MFIYLILLNFSKYFLLHSFRMKNNKIIEIFFLNNEVNNIFIVVCHDKIQ